MVKEGFVRIFVLKVERIYDVFVFYNFVMFLNRDISVFVVKVFGLKRVLDVFFVMGIRGICYVFEILVEEVWFNDISEEVYGFMKKNVSFNIDGEFYEEGDCLYFWGEKFVVINKGDVNRLMVENFRYFDFFDFDFFGFLVEFFDIVFRSVRWNGVLVVIVIDMGVFCGVYRNVCFRKYFVEFICGLFCYEVGFRIFIGIVVRYVVKYDLGVEVLLVYYCDYYFRVFLKFKSGVKKVDKSFF